MARWRVALHLARPSGKTLQKRVRLVQFAARGGYEPRAEATSMHEAVDEAAARTGTSRRTMSHLFKVEVISPETAGAVTFRFEPIAAAPVSIISMALNLMRDIQQTNLTLYQVLAKTGRLPLYTAYVDQLFLAAQSAFDSDFGSFEFAQYLVAQARSDLVSNVGPRYRRLFIRRLSWVAGCVAVISAATGFAFSIFWSLLKDHGLAFTSDGDAQSVSGSAWVIVGVCIGVWLSSVLRNRQLRWDSLTLFDPDGLPPSTRLVIVGAVTTVFCILLRLDVISLGVAGQSLSGFMNNHPLAVLVGLIGGISEDSLTKLVIGSVGHFTQTGGRAEQRVIDQSLAGDPAAPIP
jgi:hypothetical protein